VAPLAVSKPRRDGALQLRGCSLEAISGVGLIVIWNYSTELCWCLLITWVN